ncbi:MAG: glutathione peroxidase [Chitinophagaceae bacterium]
MTFMQQLKRIFYKLRMMVSGSTGLGKTTNTNTTMITPPEDFYHLQATLNNGKPLSFETLKGKHVLLVNTASDCGFTGQYDDLEKLHQQYKDKLVILGFPANDFGGQEPDNDGAIAEFCRINYGVTFPLVQKASVKGNEKQPVFQWLSEPAKNGWNNQEPTWNFCKYLVSPEGVLLHFYSSAVSPLSEEVTGALK